MFSITYRNSCPERSLLFKVTRYTQTRNVLIRRNLRERIHRIGLDVKGCSRYLWVDAAAWGVAVDHAGNVCISDTMNYRVRRIDAATGIIHTIAGTGVRGFSGDGGLALNAQITTPAGLCIDPAGRVYFADLFNQRIRIPSPLQPLPRSSLKEPSACDFAAETVSARERSHASIILR